MRHAIARSQLPRKRALLWFVSLGVLLSNLHAATFLVTHTSKRDFQAVPSKPPKPVGAKPLQSARTDVRGYVVDEEPERHFGAHWNREPWRSRVLAERRWSRDCGIPTNCGALPRRRYEETICGPIPPLTEPATGSSGSGKGRRGPPASDRSTSRWA